MITCIILSACLFFLTFAVDSVPAQTTTRFDLDDGTGWSLVQDPDASAEFGFDYSELDMPPAPHGEGTTGLRMAANTEEPGDVAIISATPTALSVRGPYTVQVDFWINYNVDESLVGTTEFIGAFIGFDATADESRNGAGLLGSSDGDASRDYRMYKDADEQSVESGQYDIVSQNNSEDFDVQIQFPGQPTPLDQTDPALFDPPNGDVTPPDGALAFGWHTLLVNVDADDGTANFTIDDLSIGTVDARIGDPVSMEGGIALTFADIFSSVSANPEFSFGVFDNLIVTHTSGSALQAGDSDMDLDFDQLDLVMVQIAAKYLTGQVATWGAGDWNGAPGGEPGNPPLGNGQFDQVDIISALSPGLYLTGRYAAIHAGGQGQDDQVSIGYDANTGELWVDPPLGVEMTSIAIDSASRIFTGDAARNLGGSFDNDSDNNLFKATFGSSFGPLSFGAVMRKGLSQQLVRSDLSVLGSLAGGGALGEVDLIYVPVPEPSGVVLGLLATMALVVQFRPRGARPQSVVRHTARRQLP